MFVPSSSFCCFFACSSLFSFFVFLVFGFFRKKKNQMPSIFCRTPPPTHTHIEHLYNFLVRCVPLALFRTHARLATLPNRGWPCVPYLHAYALSLSLFFPFPFFFTDTFSLLPFFFFSFRTASEQPKKKEKRKKNIYIYII